MLVVDDVQLARERDQRSRAVRVHLNGWIARRQSPMSQSSQILGQCRMHDKNNRSLCPMVLHKNDIHTLPRTPHEADSPSSHRHSSVWR